MLMQSVKSDERRGNVIFLVFDLIFLLRSYSDVMFRKYIPSAGKENMRTDIKSSSLHFSGAWKSFFFTYFIIPILCSTTIDVISFSIHSHSFFPLFLPHFFPPSLIPTLPPFFLPSLPSYLPICVISPLSFQLCFYPSLLRFLFQTLPFHNLNLETWVNILRHTDYLCSRGRECYW